MGEGYRGRGKPRAGRGLSAGPCWMCKSHIGVRKSGIPSWENCERNLGGRRAVYRTEVNQACLQQECSLTAKPITALQEPGK